MKNIKHLSVLILLLAIAFSAEGQIRRTVYGNGKVTKENRSTVSFTGIKASSGIDVYLTQGKNLSVTVEADENLHEHIITEVKNGVLLVYTEANIRDAEMKKVHVTADRINSISASSAGDVIGVTPVNAESLEINASSAGDIKLEVYTRSISTDISSSGDITLTGESDNMVARLSSAGDLNAFNFKVKDADVAVSSAGDADIYVTERLQAKSSSAGDINYKGDPENVDAHSSSAGGIHRR